MKSATLFINSIIEATIPIETIPLNGPEREKTVEMVADFVQGQLKSLPVLMRALFAVGMMTFRLFVRIRYLSSFNKLPLDRRSEIVSSWAWGKVALGRQLFRPLRSTALLAFYELPDVKAAIEIPAVSEEPAQLGSR
jgi:hypothetical protein